MDEYAGSLMAARLTAFRDRHPLSAERYAQVTFLALALLVVIVFTGAAVRLTGSGLGCPTWPKCTQRSIHSSLDSHGLIEFGNRILTSLVSIGAIAAWLGAFLRVPARRDLRLLALLLPLGVAVQAVVGGLSVLYGLAPGWVMVHYALSMAILVAAFELWWRARHEPEELQARLAEPSLVSVIRGLALLAAVVVLIGTAATAAGPHAGAAGTGEFVGRLDFWGLETLRRIIHIHGYLVTTLGLGTIGAWWLSRAGGSAELTKTLAATCLLLAAQGVVGILQYELELPTEIVWVHVALATLTWVGYVHAWAAAGPLPTRVSDRAGRRSSPASSYR